MLAVSPMMWVTSDYRANFIQISHPIPIDLSPQNLSVICAAETSRGINPEFYPFFNIYISIRY